MILIHFVREMHFGPSNNVVTKLFKQREKAYFSTVNMFVNIIY